jgi:hypothetical protein
MSMLGLPKAFVAAVSGEERSSMTVICTRHSHVSTA